jgi:hypothetical protein
VSAQPESSPRTRLGSPSGRGESEPASAITRSWYRSARPGGIGYAISGLLRARDGGILVLIVNEESEDHLDNILILKRARVFRLYPSALALACFAFLLLFDESIPAASLSALAESSEQRIGGMITAARGFWFFWPVKRTPPVGFGREFFLIVPMVIEKIKLTLRQSILNIST